MGEVDEKFFGFQISVKDKFLFDKKNKLNIKNEEILREIHDNIWTENKEKINLVKKSLLKIKKYLLESIDEIPKLTKNKWKSDVINYYPAIYRGGSCVSSDIFFGFDHSKKELEDIGYIMNVAVHETIHANVNYIDEKLWEKGVKDASREIVVIHYTNRIFKKLKLNLKKQKYHSMFSHLQKHSKEIEKVIGNKGYSEAVMSVDEFIKDLRA